MDTIDDIESKQRRERQQIRDDAELFEDLMRHKGWRRYLAMVEIVAQNYHATVMKPLETLLEMPKTEFAKGALTGLSLATQLPIMKIREAVELRRPSEDE
jgi:hypothetical protein